MGEFELIRQIFMPLAGQSGSAALLLGPGDDCAIQRLAPGRELVFSIDTLVEGVHFPKNYDAEKLGWRSLAVAVSDLAAMGADPECFTLALTLPEARREWLEAFAKGLGAAAKSFGIALAGGDTTRGPLTLSIQVHGSVPAGQALLRSGAQPGDLVCVSGSVGDAGAALKFLDHPDPSPDVAVLLNRYHFPSPRLELGKALRGLASAVIDVSDGLLADLGHILDASGVGAQLDADLIPMSESLCRMMGRGGLRAAVVAGDDYELCVTMPPQSWRSLAETVKCQLTVIGTVVVGHGVRMDHGEDLNGTGGYDHFGEVQ
ncbi:thiamine-phosphate kinase [Marinobacter zhejiangensis]|uniref:Thiamine-monophosphate kinase n=1 Tax=Marinobacter zhejiangensis TaxID=488535 RepID=A0A1I4S9G0_9GAMM|nr:thiamine-phosphate kinase [Marinobacter zhejiangensis]SFM60930.1 thiamine-phosphate kinase [Marinobacter zhejiangensis]